MGRPSLNVKPTLVRLAEEQLERIDALMGPNKRAQFIRDAVKEKLDRSEDADGPSIKPSNKAQED